jgi:hypothetical protein
MPYPPTRAWFLQRLFSTFANSWPGFGLLIQRVIIGLALLCIGLGRLATPAAGPASPQIIGAVLGLFVLAGLWTPVVGALVTAVEFWIVLTGGSDVSISLMLAAFRHFGDDWTGRLVHRRPSLWKKAYRKLNTPLPRVPRKSNLETPYGTDKIRSIVDCIHAVRNCIVNLVIGALL